MYLSFSVFVTVLVGVSMTLPVAMIFIGEFSSLLGINEKRVLNISNRCQRVSSCRSNKARIKIESHALYTKGV